MLKHSFGIETYSVVKELSSLRKKLVYVTSASLQVLHLTWWRHADSNRRPSACKADALPTELCPRLLEWWAR